MTTRRRFLVHVTAVLSCLLGLSSQPEASFAVDAPAPAPGKQVGQQFRSTTNKMHSCRYLVFLPRSYKSTGRPTPLLLFLHGSGERGDNLEKVKAHGPPKIVQKRPNFPFVVVSPQVAATRRFNAPALLELLDHLQSTYNVDKMRTAVTGLSMGGAGTWAVANAAPGRFSAIVPICGTSTIKTQRFLKLPTWVTVGGKDKPRLVESLKKTVADLKAQGAPIRFTLYPRLGHNCWDATYNDPELYRWILDQSTSKRPGRSH